MLNTTISFISNNSNNNSAISILINMTTDNFIEIFTPKFNILMIQNIMSSQRKFAILDFDMN